MPTGASSSGECLAYLGKRDFPIECTTVLENTSKIRKILGLEIVRAIAMKQANSSLHATTAKSQSPSMKALALNTCINWTMPMHAVLQAWKIVLKIG